MTSPAAVPHAVATKNTKIASLVMRFVLLAISEPLSVTFGLKKNRFFVEESQAANKNTPPYRFSLNTTRYI